MVSKRLMLIKSVTSCGTEGGRVTGLLLLPGRMLVTGVVNSHTGVGIGVKGISTERGANERGNRRSVQDFGEVDLSQVFSQGLIADVEVRAFNGSSQTRV